MGSMFRSHDSLSIHSECTPLSLGTKDALNHFGKNPFPNAALRNVLHGRCEGFRRNPAVVETILAQPLFQAGAFAELLGNPSPGEGRLQIRPLCTKLLVLGLDVILAVFTVMLLGKSTR